MSNEGPLTPDFCPTITAYTAIRVNGTEADPTYGFVDAWGMLHCQPWYTLDGAQLAADAERFADERKE